MRRRSFDSRNGLAELFGGEPGATSAGWKPLLFPGIWLIYLLQTAGGVDTYSDGVVAAVGYAAIVAFGASYLLAIHAARTNPVMYRRFFAAMIVLTFIEIPIAHEDAFVMCVFIAVLVMAGFAFRGHGCAAIPIVAMTAIATFLPAAIPAWDAEPDWNMLITLPLVSLAMFGFFSILRGQPGAERGARRGGPPGGREREVLLDRPGPPRPGPLPHDTITVKAGLEKPAGAPVTRRRGGGPRAPPPRGCAGRRGRLPRRDPGR